MPPDDELSRLRHFADDAPQLDRAPGIVELVLDR